MFRFPTPSRFYPLLSTPNHAHIMPMPRNGPRAAAITIAPPTSRAPCRVASPETRLARVPRVRGVKCASAAGAPLPRAAAGFAVEVPATVAPADPGRSTPRERAVRATVAPRAVRPGVRFILARFAPASTGESEPPAPPRRERRAAHRGERGGVYPSPARSRAAAIAAAVSPAGSTTPTRTQRNASASSGAAANRARTVSIHLRRAGGSSS